MDSDQFTPASPFSPDDLDSCAKKVGIAIPLAQQRGVLEGAKHLADAAERIRRFLARDER